METGAITDYIDVAQMVLYAFWIFFAGLIFYLRREDKREGYPLESDRSDFVQVVGFPGLPEPKKFVLPHGGGVRYAPRQEAEESYPLAAEPAGHFPGAPLEPTGDPLVDAVGPASYAMRPNVPDLTHHGTPRIVPMRVATEFSIEPRDPDPRGKRVYGADGKAGATVRDIWVDRGEPQIRYLEMEVDANGKIVLLPMNFVRVKGAGLRINVVSIRSDQFANVPTLANPDQITLREEDKVCAYYGGGHLYAFPKRSEPLL
ncbi:MAG: photosynthetic reaction center subunit H [Gammaproteobacteria bacterium]|nr:photosynthetic reaction center subunit H [Gammaproteobacteria bacterium]